MRLLKIGRDASCDIVMHSDKVSSLHAELTLLNSGDIMLEDKGSRNGTFIMNQQIKPNKPVNVRRGDAIRFADVELQWSQVPMPEDNSAYQGLYGIGSHFNNDFQISGSTVSRYHATVKHGRDGKMYIFDHSKNGTTVDGTKIQSNTPYRIKKSSAVVCGGVPVDLSRLPWPSETWKYVLGIAASLLVLVGIGFGVWKIIPKGKTYNDTELYAMYNNSVVLLIGNYHYEVSAGNLKPEYLLAAGIPTKFKLFNNEIITEDNPNYASIISQATGFFVSESGHILTNLHVTKPWLFDEKPAREKLEEICKIMFHDFAQKKDLEATLEGRTAMFDAYTSQIKVEGKLDRILMIPQGRIYSSENAERCQEISKSDNSDIDVALIQTEKGELPKKARCINPDSIDVSEDALKIGHHMYYLGFPDFSSKPKDESGIQLEAHGGNITHSNLEFLFGFDAASDHGASGSPVFNERGMLIGILNSGFEKQGFNYGIKAKYIKELIDNPHKK